MRSPRRWWRSRSARNNAGVVPRGSFAVEAQFHRTEELRPDVMGVPSEDELNGSPHDPWRPARSLGKLPEY